MTEEMSLACQHGRCHLCTDFDGWNLGPCTCVCHIPEDSEAWRCPSCQCVAAANDYCNCPCHRAPEYQHHDD